MGPEIALAMMIINGLIKTVPKFVEMFKGLDPDDPRTQQIIEEYFKKNIEESAPPAWDEI